MTESKSSNRKINYKSDFSFILDLKHLDTKNSEQDVGFPNYDFTILLYTNKFKKYVVKYTKNPETFVNCANFDGNLQIILNNHRLGQGVLYAEVYLELPNESFPDGKQLQVCPIKLDIELVDECTEELEVDDVIFIAPYIKGDKGDPLTWDTMPEEDKEDLVGKVKVVVEEEAPFTKGEGEGSAALKGMESVSGLKGYAITHIDFSNKSIYVSDATDVTNTQPISGAGTIDSSFLLEYKVDDIISITNNKKHYNCSTIISIEGNKITVNALPFEDILTHSDTVPVNYVIYCLNKPNVGLCNIGGGAVALGSNNAAINFSAYSEGYNNKSYGHYSHTEGRDNIAWFSAHAEGRNTQATDIGAHSEGLNTKASASAAHAEGCTTTASGLYAHSEGNTTIASGANAHAEGSLTTAEGHYSHAEGVQSHAEGRGSHAEGGNSVGIAGGHAVGVGSHAEGAKTLSSGNYSHAEGYESKANGVASHAEGYMTNAIGAYSHTEGMETETSNNLGEHAQGKYNVSNSNTIHSVGIGTSTSDRKNAHEIMRDGKHYIYGIGGYNGTNPQSSQDIVTILNGKTDIAYLPVLDPSYGGTLSNAQFEEYYRVWNSRGTIIFYGEAPQIIFNCLYTSNPTTINSVGTEISEDGTIKVYNCEVNKNTHEFTIQLIGTNSSAQPDWSVGDIEGGHIKGRTHWIDTSYMYQLSLGDSLEIIYTDDSEEFVESISFNPAMGNFYNKFFIWDNNDATVMNDRNGPWMKYEVGSHKQFGEMESTLWDIEYVPYEEPFSYAGYIKLHTRGYPYKDIDKVLSKIFVEQDFSPVRPLDDFYIPDTVKIELKEVSSTVYKDVF